MGAGECLIRFFWTISSWFHYHDPHSSQYQLLVDRNAHRRHVPPDFELKTFYGELKHIIVVMLAPSEELGLTTPTQYILADIVACKADIDGPLGVRLFDSMQAPQVVDITCCQCLVGRWKTVRAHGRPLWAILDRSGENGEVIVADNDWENGAGETDRELTQ